MIKIPSFLGQHILLISQCEFRNALNAFMTILIATKLMTEYLPSGDFLDNLLRRQLEQNRSKQFKQLN